MSKIDMPLLKFRQYITRGFTLIELVIVISIVAILSATALDKLFWYQSQAEKAAMEYTATMIKSGLWMSVAGMMMDNRTTEIPSLMEHNPINLLAQKPDNYLGEIKNADASTLASGNWFYDINHHQVVYIVAHRRNFIPDKPGDFTIRYGMKMIYSEIESTPKHKASYVAGIALVPSSKYTWH